MDLRWPLDIPGVLQDVHDIGDSGAKLFSFSTICMRCVSILMLAEATPGKHHISFGVWPESKACDMGLIVNALFIYSVKHVSDLKPMIYK